MKALSLLALAAILPLAPLQARLGETEGLSQQRYGQPREDLTSATDKPLLPGAVEKAYEYQGFRVRAAFAGGLCVVIEYAKIPTEGVPIKLTDKEMVAILEAEKGKSRWKEAKVKEQGVAGEIARGIQGAFNLKKWERTDGAIAEMALGLVLKLSARDADDWAKRLAREAAKQPPKPTTPGPAVPKF